MDEGDGGEEKLWYGGSHGSGSHAFYDLFKASAVLCVEDWG